MLEERIRVIINPVSGVESRKREIIAQLEKSFTGKAEIVFSRKKGDAGVLAADAVKNNFSAVIAVGGDGSINECASELVNTEVALGIIPAGSGNGLARCLHIPFNVEKAVDCIMTFNTHKIDSIRINDCWVFSISGFGLDARVAKLYSKEKKRGFYPYFKLTLQEYLKFKTIPYEIFINERKIRGKALFVSIANSNQFGYKTVIAGNAKVDDGLVDVCIFEKVPLLQIPVIAPFFFLHKLDYTGYMQVYQASGFQVLSRQGKLMNIEGEAVKMKRKLDIQVHPSSLRVIIPKIKKG
jgi:YegS/Rv2252/BmrU family lipid kinase